MFCQGLERLQSDVFRGLNAVLEPLVRSGVGAPGPWPTGLVVVETRGRKTGRAVRVPLLGTRVGDLVVVSTVRGRAHWVRNAAAAPGVRYWMNGRAHDAIALVVAPDGESAPAGAASPLATALAASLLPWSRALGMGFAVLSPASASPG
jgi:hypothetical protein